MTTKKKRNLFAELKQGIQEVKNHKTGKITLRTHKLEKKPRPKITPAIILETREIFNMSRAVFAIKLGVSVRTLEKWEQGKIVPNDQAAVLILLVRKYPDTLKRLEDIQYTSSSTINKMRGTASVKITTGEVLKLTRNKK